jgi:membrane-bound inhibitor of C-type lysozyme
MTFKRMVFYIVILVLVVIVGYSVVHKNPAAAPVVTAPAPVVISTANYSCDNNATINAAFTNNSVTIDLSDGRHLVLPQTISADGAQYQQGPVLLVTKGDQAFLQENGITTYSNCLAGAPASPVTTDGLKSFTDQGKTFTFMYPQQFTLAGGGIGYTESWKTNTDGTLGLILATVNVPQSYQPKTNFGDAKFTVGTSSDPKAVTSCLTDTNGNGITKSTVTINGTKYTKFVSTDAGAGQRYETTSYRTVRNSQCYAIEYTIHYSVLANFDPSMGVTAFDQKKVEGALDSIVQSFTFL